MCNQPQRNFLMMRAVAYLGFQCQLAETLGSKYGIGTILIGDSPLDLQTFRRIGHDPGVFADIVYAGAVEMNALRETPPDDATLQADIARVESAYGIHLNDAIRSDRLYGQGFVSGAQTMRTPFMRRADYSHLLLVAIRMADFMAGIIRKHKPELVIAYPGGLASHLLVEIAAVQGIPMRALSAPRRGTYFYWTADRHGFPAGFERQFNAILRTLTASVDADGASQAMPETPSPPAQSTNYILSRKRKLGVRAFISGFFGHAKASFSYYWFRHPRRAMIYAVPDRLAAFVHAWAGDRRAMRELPLLSHHLSTPYIFFPLHFEPEATLLNDAVDSPSQITIIDWLARAAPAGWRVVVKEHPTQWLRRPAGFWNAVRRYPNVLVAAKFESGEALMEGATAVALINGTLGLQAASRLKPVISFHRNYVGKVLPQVQVVESYGALSAALRDIADGRVRATRLWNLALEAWRRAWALHEFSIAETELYNGQPIRKHLPAAEIRAAADRLIDSFEPQRAPTAPLTGH